MRLHNRRGIELAASTVVLLIVATAILGLAVTLTYRVTCAAEEYSAQVDAQAQRQVERLLTTSGSTVVLAQNRKTAEAEGSALCGSSRMYTATYTVGISHADPGGGTIMYNVSVFNESGVPDGLRMLGDPSGTGYLYDVDPGEQRVISILLLAPDDAHSGAQYEYTLSVEGAGKTHVRTLYFAMP